MTKKFTLICPDVDCGHQFEHVADPKTIGDGGDLIVCPECKEEWEWEYDLKDGTLALLPDEDDFESDELDLDDEADLDDESELSDDSDEDE